MAKVLIVEDNFTLSKMYQKVLTFSGFEVEVANDGEEGLQKVSEFNPNIILLDIMMPKKSGLETLEELKANDLTKNIPVVMLTSLSQEGNIQEAMSKGAAKYFQKEEADPQQIVNIIHEILGKPT